MDNLLTLYRLLSRNIYLHGPHSHSRVSKYGNIFFSDRDPIPAISGSLIETLYSTRRLFPDKLEKSLEFRNTKNQSVIIKSLKQTTSIFYWEYLSISITDFSKTYRINNIVKKIKPILFQIENSPIIYTVLKILEIENQEQLYYNYLFF